MNRKVKNIKYKDISKIFKKLTSPSFKSGYIFALLTFLIIIILTANVGPTYNLKEGEMSPFDYKAPYMFEVPDEENWEKAKKEAYANVEPVYSYNIEALTKSIDDVENLFINLLVTSNRKDLSPEEKLNHFNTNYNKGFSNDSTNYLLTLDEEQIKNILNESKKVTKEIMEEKIKPRQLSEYVKEIDKKYMVDVDLSEDEKVIVAKIVERFLRPTAVYEEAKTQRQREEAASKVPLTKIPVKANEAIVQEGYPITRNALLILEYIGLTGKSLTWKQILSTSSLVFLSVLSFAIYLYKFHPSNYLRIKNVILLSIIILSFTIIIRIFSEFVSKLIMGPSLWWGYIIPIAAASMIVTILFDSHLGIITTFILTVFNGILTAGFFNFFLVALISGVFAVYLVSKVSERQKIIKAGVLLALIIGLLVFTINIPNANIKLAFFYSLIGFANGLICTIITLGAIPFLENLFNITTSMRLLELSNPNQHLLKRLIKNAPGTYNHSLLVANLAESAAEAIGADALLVRVASYYHDIGKLKRPSSFIENLSDKESIHEYIKPSLSKLIIANHVKDGVSMAKRARLPKEIIDCIAQHHGNSIISYFYNKQKKLEEAYEEEKTTEQVFRYLGEKPKSKEAAILMFADIVQAGGKAMTNPTTTGLKRMIDDFIEDKLEDHQLDESDLTLKEIQTIADSFYKTLVQGIFHSRIEYPDKESNDKKKEPKNTRNFKEDRKDNQ
ncbi:MAG: HDIG domain-containing protein [Actinobacteria bacterium]|nr:HDIG domain-containing protein [Actinomycetota bacterium]